jgi:cytochrome d ubiquinol oxidase subunit I
MLIASLLTSAFLVAGVSAWRALKQVDSPASWKVLKTGVVLAAVLAPLQIVVGDLHGLNTHAHQPAKIAAMEAVWETERGVPLVLFALPDEERRVNRWAVEIPFAASLILTHRADGELRGLNEFEGAHPPVAVVFWSFRIMVGMGLLMLAVAWWASWSLRQNRQPGKILLRVLSWMTFSGWVAVLAGWYVTEIGRQPWMVAGLLRVGDLVADHGAGTMLGTLAGYLALYVFLLVAYIGAIRHLSTRPAQSLQTVPRDATRSGATAG